MAVLHVPGSLLTAAVCRLFCAAVALTTTQMPQAAEPDPFVFEEHTVEIHGTPSQIRITGDAVAGNGKSVWIAAGQRGWLFQWPWDSTAFLKGYQYRILLKVRPDAPEGGEAAVSGGVYERFTLGQGRTAARFRQTLFSADADPWHMVEIGELPLADMFGYVYVLTHDAPVAVDAIVVEPVLTDANREAYTRARAEGRREVIQRNARLEAIRGRVRPQPQLEALFLFGVVLVREAVLTTAELTGVPWEWEFRQCLHDLKRHYCNFDQQLSLDAVHPEMLPSARILEEEGIYSVNGDVKVLPSIFSAKHDVNEPRLTAFLRAQAPRFAEFTHFLAWSLADEPLPGRLYDYIVAKDIIESLDAQRPALPILNTEEVIRLYAPYQQVAVLDYYTIRRRGANPWAVGERVRFGREHCTGPVWFLYGAYSSRGMRMPTRPETRLMIHQGLLSGAKGLACYSYHSRPTFIKSGHAETLTDTLRTSTPVWEEIGRIGKRLVPVGRLLAEATPVPEHLFGCDAGTVQTISGPRPAVELAAWRYGKTTVLLAVNNDLAQPVTARIGVGDASWPGGLAIDLGTSEFAARPVRSGIDLTLEPAGALALGIGTDDTLAACRSRIRQYRFEQEMCVLELDLKLMANHGIDTAPFRRRLDQIRPGPGMSDAVSEWRESARAALDRETRFSAHSTQLGVLAEHLSGAEARLEVLASEHGVPTARQAAVEEWRQLVRVFGSARYRLLEGQVFDAAAVAAATLQAQQLLASLK